jgi:hypothetical protein
MGCTSFRALIFSVVGKTMKILTSSDQNRHLHLKELFRDVMIYYFSKLYLKNSMLKKYYHINNPTPICRQGFRNGVGSVAK